MTNIREKNYKEKKLTVVRKEVFQEATIFGNTEVCTLYVTH